MENKYFYNGEPLIEFCKRNPEYKYNHITKYISDKLKKDPTRSIDDIINEYMSKPHRSNIRYIINGMNLSKYCNLNNISYDAVIKSISRARKDIRYKDLSENEIIDMILDKYISDPDIEELDFGEPKKLELSLNNKKEITA